MLRPAVSLLIHCCSDKCQLLPAVTSMAKACCVYRMGVIILMLECRGTWAARLNLQTSFHHAFVTVFS